MKKEELFNDDFLKQFKTGDELNGFLKELQKRGIEKMLEGELDGHLGFDKNQKSKTGNTRDGYASKTVRTSFGESQIAVPRDRDASFNSMIVPKRGTMVEDIENVILSLYAKGMSNSDIEEQIREVYNFDISTSTISRITNKISGDIVAWQNRPLEPIYLIVWIDGIVFKVRENSKVINKIIYGGRASQGWQERISWSMAGQERIRCILDECTYRYVSTCYRRYPYYRYR